MYIEGGCPNCGYDESHERYLRWEKETEEWAAKYRSGELTEIPDEYNPFNRENGYTNSAWMWGGNDLHPAIRGFFKFKYENMNIFEFLSRFGGSPEL